VEGELKMSIKTLALIVWVGGAISGALVATRSGNTNADNANHVKAGPVRDDTGIDSATYSTGKVYFVITPDQTAGRVVTIGDPITYETDSETGWTTATITLFGKSRKDVEEAVDYLLFKRRIDY
jgi:hypothetical protein